MLSSQYNSVVEMIKSMSMLVALQVFYSRMGRLEPFKYFWLFFST